MDDSLLLAYLDGELDARRRAEVAAMLAQSPEARARIESLQRVQRELHTTLSVIDQVAPPPLALHVLRRGARRSFAPLVGTLVRVVLVSVVALLVLAATPTLGRLVQHTFGVPVRTQPATPEPDATALASVPAAGTPHPLLGDARVRQAITGCIDTLALLRTAAPWVADTAPFVRDSFLPATHWGYAGKDGVLTRYPFDPARSAALLDEAGWTLAGGATIRTNAAGQPLMLTLTSTPSRLDQPWVAELVTQLRACGVGLALRSQEPDVFFGAQSVLQRRDFDLALFSQLSQPEPDVAGITCTAIPGVANGWQGSNFSGWCDPQVDAALAGAGLERARRQAALAQAQAAYTRDLPGIPLFSRPQTYAVHPALTHFAPDPTELYTWNAAQWSIPGQDTIVLAERSEPASLYAGDQVYVSRLVRALVMGLDYTSLSYDYQPVTLTQLPTIENGGTWLQTASVTAGAAVIDADGRAVELQPGVRVRTFRGDVVVYTGGSVELPQLVTRYVYVAGLTWSDGTPVSQADYALYERVVCDPQTGAAEYWTPPAACATLAQVEYLSDTSYVVTRKPGYLGADYMLPPIGRLPAHQRISDGRRLGDVPASEWGDLPEVTTRPLGIGPYMIESWAHGRELVLVANPYYAGGMPATGRIVVRFVEQARAGEVFAAGGIDVLGWDTLSDAQIPAVQAAQAAGRARLVVVPSPMYEQLVFAVAGP